PRDANSLSPVPSAARPSRTARLMLFSFMGRTRLPSRRGEYQLRLVTSPHSHSIIFGHGNALIFRRKFFRVRRRTVSPIRQKFTLLIYFKHEFQRSAVCSASATIGINRLILLGPLSEQPRSDGAIKYRPRSDIGRYP